MTTQSSIHETNGKQAAPARALTTEVRADGVAVVTYDVPGEPVNTLKATFAEEFERVFAEVARDPKIKAAVIASGKKDGFIAGADVTMLKSAKTASEAEALARTGHAAILHVVDCPKPVVAAVHGAALGGGFEVALACHGRVLSDDKKTALGFPEVQLGLLPGMNGLERLAAITGLQVALDYGLTGKNMRAVKAKSLGVADEVVPAAILVDAAAKLALALADKGQPFTRRPAPQKKKALAERATTLALEGNAIGRKILFQQARKELRKKTGGHYPAPERIVDVLEVYAKQGFGAAREVEAKAFGELVVSNVARRLMEIFFAQTALKKDTGVDDPSVQPREVSKIEMLGAGLMGAGIAYVSIDGGYHVRLKDRDDPSLGRGLKYVSDILDERVKKKSLTRVEQGQKLGLLTATTDTTGLASADVVIEAVFEDLAVKHAVLKEVEAAARPSTVFASNTSSIPITKIAAGSKRPENVVGMHYFSPVHKMPLLEVIRTKQTSPEVVATAVAIGKRQGKTVIVVNDGVGFYTSRVLGPMMNEASYLLVEGAGVEEIDRAMTAWGWPVGPVTLLDEVGIDVAAHIGPIMVEAFGERMKPPPTMEKLVADGRKGRKNEKGFYLYGAAAKELGKGKHVDPSIYAALGLDTPKGERKAPVVAEEIQMRCSLQLVNEAMHCFGEGILRSVRDGDIGAVFGLGFPPFRGGPFRYVDAADEVLRRVKGYEQRFGARWTPAPALVEHAQKKQRFHA
jgi:3-hydroxyacyl-CoA dehydrogenase/enoyl-CoA hydratase/3-hydroxybutyryl-CoA epimerase